MVNINILVPRKLLLKVQLTKYPVHASICRLFVLAYRRNNIVLLTLVAVIVASVPVYLAYVTQPVRNIQRFRGLCSLRFSQLLKNTLPTLAVPLGGWWLLAGVSFTLHNHQSSRRCCSHSSITFLLPLGHISQSASTSGDYDPIRTAVMEKTKVRLLGRNHPQRRQSYYCLAPVMFG